MNAIKRLEYIDFLKAVGILAVIWGHIYTKNDTIYQFVYSFHVPLFFVLSGVFFNPNQTLKEFLAKRINKLIIPYLFFYLITYFYWVFIERELRAGVGGVNAEWWRPIIGLFYESPYWDLFAHNNPLWFIPTLFSIEILSCIFRKCTFYTRILIGLIGIIVSIICASYSILLPFGLISAFYCYLFYSLAGGVKYINNTPHKPCVLLVVVIVYGIYIYKFGYTPSPIFGPSINAAFTYYIIALCTIFSLILLAQSIRKWGGIWLTFFSYIGRNTLIILCLHDPVKRAVIFMYSKISNQTMTDIRHDLVDSLICLIITVMVLYPIIQLYNKYVKPRLAQIAVKH